MAHGEAPNRNFPFAAGVRAANVNLRPQYVISTRIRNGNVERVLPDIRIPLYLTASHPDLFMGFVDQALRNLLRFPLTPGPEPNPLLELLDQNADYWNVEVNSAGDSLGVSFYAVHNTVPQEVESPLQNPEGQPSSASNSASESGERSEQQLDSLSANGSQNSMVSSPASFDDEQPGALWLHSSGTSAPSNQSSRSQTDVRRGIKRKNTSSDRLAGDEAKKRRADELLDMNSASCSSSSTSSPTPSREGAPGDDEQPGALWLHSSGTSAPSKQSSRSQTDVSRGVKRKTTSSDTLDGDEVKKRRSDELVDLDPASCSSSSTPSREGAPGDDEQPDASRQESSSEVGGRDERRNQELGQRGKRARKSSGGSKRRQRKGQN